MGKIFEITTEFIETIPDELKEGVLYISDKYGIAIHLCACGCKQKTVTDLKPRWKDGWIMTNNNGFITLRPSIGNFNGESPYHAHYFITDNRVEWL